MEEVGEVLVVTLGAGRYAIPVAGAAHAPGAVEVGRVPPLTRLPGAPGWLAGVANWRGRVLAVLDLRGELGEPVAAPARPSAAADRVIVLVGQGVSAAVLVDRVHGLAPLAELATSVQPLLPGVPSGAARLQRGYLTDADGPVALIDVVAVLGLRHGLSTV